MYTERNNNKEKTNKTNREFNNKEIGRNKKYGEQIPSLFSWITPEEQKKKAEKLENITKGKNRPS